MLYIHRTPWWLPQKWRLAPMSSVTVAIPVCVMLETLLSNVCYHHNQQGCISAPSWVTLCWLGLINVWHLCSVPCFGLKLSVVVAVSKLHTFNVAHSTLVN